MSKKLLLFAAFISLWCIAPFVYAQGQPVEVSGCTLAKNPNAFDGKQIRVRGTLNVHFEDFTLGILNCDSHQVMWLMFGGDVPGFVASTWNDATRKPGIDVKVNDVSYGIKKDDDFRKLYALAAARHGDKRDYQVTATLTGTFLASKETKTQHIGYGHLGCCSLLVITQVSDVESVPPANLDVRGTLFGPDGKPLKGFTVYDDILGGTPPERQKTIANENGEFAFSNSGQQLRFESLEYRPIAITVEPGSAPVRVTLQDAKKSDWVIRTCEDINSGNRAGFSVLFTLPKTMESSPFDSDDWKSIFVYPHGGSPPEAELIISHNPDETTDAADSLGSEWFEERWVKDITGNIVGMDARGREKLRGYWRRVVFFGYDTAGYNTSSGKRKLLDQIIDSACIAKNATP